MGPFIHLVTNLSVGHWKTDGVKMWSETPSLKSADACILLIPVTDIPSKNRISVYVSPQDVFLLRIK